MIFVIVGTQGRGFFRCLKAVEALIDKYHIDEEIIAQIGDTKFSTDKFKCIPYVGEEEFKQLIAKSSVVITHAGSGAIFNSIKAGKKVIAMARLKEYNEMRNNHQTELVMKLSKDGYILDGTYSLAEAWEKLDSFIPRTCDFKCTLPQEIGKLIDEWLK